MTVVWRGRGAVRNSQSGRHLGQRSCATAPTGRTYDRKRSDQNTVQHPCEAGAVHISHVSGLCTRHFMTAGPDVLRWKLVPLRLSRLTDARRCHGLSRSGGPCPLWLHIISSSPCQLGCPKGRSSELVVYAADAAAPMLPGSYAVLLAITAQAIRAILLARATATTLNGFLARRPRAQSARAVRVLPDFMR